ncbi:hypothetical protein C5167_045215 [Papaver somniferum]|uniref:Uncharacterized protein n=1 Tax=Papaver somniferum TaxID=3469 RepID=A0A4Y7LE34_PAPSO|nr:hypothetical protein C5167_045215 [Papaver somniferum]
MAGIMAKPEVQGRIMASIICWLLGVGCLLSWNSIVTIQDYYQHLFPLDLATSGGGGLGRFIGLCSIVVIVAVAQGSLEGGLFGDLSMMCPEFMQVIFIFFLGSIFSFYWFVSTEIYSETNTEFSEWHGCIRDPTSFLRLITKASFENSRSGLRKGAMVFLSNATSFMLLCALLYAFFFAKLPIVKYYRSKAASEGSKTVAAGTEMQQIGIADEEDGHKQQLERLTTKQLLIQNLDLAMAILLIHALTLSIFPGFLSEDTGKHSLGSWYASVLITVHNFLDFVGRYLPVSEGILSRKVVLGATLSRFLLIPCFYFTAKSG